MACGTGKTFAALRIAERIAGVGGRALYLVPSISLFQQSMREWAEQRAVPHRYVGICSDTRAGRNDEDASLHELEIPVTTDPARILEALREPPPDAVTVVFCTYHSLGLVEQAQDDGAPPFDLILCDEAHRTTGIERPRRQDLPVRPRPRRSANTRAGKRLYMTATPRLYTEGAKAKAANHAVEVFSMDDPATYGPQFHRLPFSRAVEQDLLSDYKVVVLAMSEDHVAAALQAHLAKKEGSEINLDDAAKIVGCWRALQNPENLDPAVETPSTRLAAPSRSRTRSDRRSASKPTGRASSNRPCLGCHWRRGREPSAARPGMWTASTTRWTARPASNGSRDRPRAAAASFPTPAACQRASTCRPSTPCCS